MESLRQGEFILMDGALGTELERRGVPFEGNGWSAYAVRDHGEVIRQTHVDYLQAGAKLHIVNSFALARHVLEPIGLAAEFEELNRRSVVLFDEAVERIGMDRGNLWVAGSLSTFAANSNRSLLPDNETLLVNYRDQARVLYDSGVDLFVLEMLFDIETTRVMLKAVEEFGLPVILGFTCDWQAGSGNSKVSARGMGKAPILLREILPDLIVALGTADIIMSIMHSDPDVTDAALEELKQCWSGPVAVYPNSGEFVDLRMQFDTVCSVESFQQAANRWIDGGVQIVGGCCGIGPEHIQGLSGPAAGRG